MALEERTLSQRPRSALIENYPAVPHAIPRARRAVKALAVSAGAEGERLEAIQLAASEALTNVVLHAYPDQPGRMHVAAHLTSEGLWLSVSDDGAGLVPRRSPSPGLGLGLGLIAQMADEFNVVERGEGGVELRMRFDLREDGGGGWDYPRGSFASATRPASPRFSTTM